MSRNKSEIPVIESLNAAFQYTMFDFNSRLLSFYDEEVTEQPKER